MSPISKRGSNCGCSLEFRTEDQRLSRQEAVCGRSRASCGILLPSSLTEERAQRRHDSCGSRKRHSEQRPPRSCALISKPTHKRLHPPQHTSPASRTKMAMTNPLISPWRPHYAHPNRLYEIFQTAVPGKDHAVSLVADIRLNAPGIETLFDANSD